MSLFSNVLTVGGTTLVSRVLGFVRDALIAAVLGSGPAADALFVAFRLPNLFRRLFAEGAFAAAFVPLFVRRRAEAGEVAAREFAGRALAALTLAAALVTLAAVVFAPDLIDLLAPGFADDGARRALTIDLARLCLPYLVAMTVVALLSGLMTADRRFLVPALAPVAFNLTMIAALAGLLLVGATDRARAATVLAVGFTAAGLVQVGLLVLAVARAGLRPPIALPRLTPDVRRLLRLGLPGLLAGAMSEINIVVGTIIASSTAGAVSWLYYADRLYQLPLGVVGIAVGQVLLPEIAHRLAAADPAAGRDVQNRALELALALALPAALALALLAEPIMRVLFERGAFTGADTVAAARALAFFAAGLPAFVLVRVFAPAFFAREDTATPMLVGALAVAVNVALAFALHPHLGWLSVALATSLAGWVNAVALFAVLLARRHWALDVALLRRLPRLALAALAMIAAVAAARHALDPMLAASAAPLGRAFALAGLVAAGLATYAGLVLALRVFDPAALRALLTSRRAAADAQPSCPRPEDRA